MLVICQYVKICPPVMLQTKYYNSNSCQDICTVHKTCSEYISTKVSIFTL